MHQETLLHETENRKNAKLKNSTNSNFFAKKFEISMKLSTFDQKLYQSNRFKMEINLKQDWKPFYLLEEVIDFWLYFDSIIKAT